MTIPKKKHSGSRGRGKRVSIYLPEDVAEMIVGKPDISMSRVVREALLVHFGKIENVENYGRALQKLSALEIQLHSIKEMLSSFFRSAAKHVDLVVVPTQEWDQITERIAVSDREDREHEQSVKQLGDQVSSLEKKLAEALKEIETLSDRKSFLVPSVEVPSEQGWKCPSCGLVNGPQIETCSCSTEEAPTKDTPSCATCGSQFADYVDANCSSCGKPLCWSCFAGDTGVEDEPVGKCSGCLKAAQEAQEVSGQTEEPTPSPSESSTDIVSEASPPDPSGG
jgi:hypothetical protein